MNHQRLLNPDNPLDLIPAMLATNPEAVAVISVFAPADPDSSLVLGAKTHRRRLPPDLAAKIASDESAANGNGTHVKPPTHIDVGRLLLTIPADLAKNLRGPASERHPLVLIAVHRDAYDMAVRQAQSGIVLPNAQIVAGGKVIV